MVQEFRELALAWDSGGQLKSGKLLLLASLYGILGVLVHDRSDVQVRSLFPSCGMQR